MPTLARRKSKAKARSTGPARKPVAKRRSRGPSFGAWIRKYAGMVKDAPADLSMREGFGN